MENEISFVFRDDNIVYLNSEITKESIHELMLVSCEALVESVTNEKRFTLYINSHGGDYLEALRYVDFIRIHILPYCPDALAVVHGVCFSSAVHILLSFNYRKATQLSSFMVHELSMTQEAMRLNSLRSEMALHDELDRLLRVRITEITGWNDEQIKKFENYETYWTADQAKLHNIIQEVL